MRLRNEQEQVQLQTWTRIRASWLPKSASQGTLRDTSSYAFSKSHKSQKADNFLLCCWARAADSHTLKTIIKMLINFTLQLQPPLRCLLLFRLLPSTSPSPLARFGNRNRKPEFESRHDSTRIGWLPTSNLCTGRHAMRLVFWRNRKGQQQRSQICLSAWICTSY